VYEPTITEELMHSQEHAPDGTTLSQALGWFSIALGVAELAAPRQVARWIGVRPTDETNRRLRSYGAREVASGIGILAQPSSSKWLWSRVGGDAVDLMSLGQASRRPGTNETLLTAATLAVLGVTALDVIAAQSLRAKEEHRDPIGFDTSKEQAITVRTPLEAVETAWTEWCASGEAGLKNDYVIRFEVAPGARGTEIHLAGGGSKGAIRQELRRFKQKLETGEISVSDGPGLWRAAQPTANAGGANPAEVLR